MPVVTIWSQSIDGVPCQFYAILMLRKGCFESGHRVVLVDQVTVRKEVEGDADVGVSDHRRVAMSQIVEAYGTRPRALCCPFEGTVDRSLGHRLPVSSVTHPFRVTVRLNRVRLRPDNRVEWRGVLGVGDPVVVVIFAEICGGLRKPKNQDDKQVGCGQRAVSMGEHGVHTPSGRYAHELEVLAQEGAR